MKNINHNFFFSVVALITALLGFPTVSAQTAPTPTHIFNGTTNTTFGTNTNWLNNTLPLLNSHVLIADGKTATMSQVNADTLFGSLTLGVNSTLNLGASNTAGLAGGSVLYFNNGSQLNYTSGGTNRANTYNIVSGATVGMHLGQTGGDSLPQGTMVGGSNTVVNMTMANLLNMRLNASSFSGTLNFNTNVANNARAINFGNASNLLGSGITNIGTFVRVTGSKSNLINDSGTLQLTGSSGGASNVKFDMGGSADTIANFVIDTPIGATASAPTLRGSATAFTVSGTTTFQGTAGAVNFDSNNATPSSHNLITTGNMTFGGTGTWAVAGDGVIRLNAASGTRTITTNTNASIANTLAGTQDFTKTGNGTLTLTGNNTYTGATAIQAGALVANTNSAVSTNGAFGNASSALVLGNGSTAAGDAPAVLINGAFTVARAITVGSLANTAAYNATIGGRNTTGTSIFSGNITLNTTAANYTATLQAATGGTTEFSTGTWTTNNKAIAIGSSGNAGIVRLSNAITTIGGINVNFGTLELNSAFSNGNMAVASGTTLSGTGSVAGTTGVAGGTINGTGLTLTGLTTFNSTGNTLSGTVSTNASLASAAALVLNGALTGTLDIGNGTLTGIGGSVSSAATLNGGIVNLTSGTLNSTLGVTGGSWNGNGSVTGLITSSSGTFTIGNAANLTANSGVSVSGGTLVINGTLTGALSTLAGTTVYGSGSITGTTTIAGNHNPGNSPGIQNFGGDLSYSGGTSAVQWELNDNAILNSPVVFDQIIVSGNLDFTDLTTMNLVFNGLGSAVDWNNALWASNQSWTIYDVAGTTTNFSNLQLTSIDWLDSNGLAYSSSPNAGGTFALGQNGQDVVLNYTAYVIPEPKAVLLGCLGVLLFLRRRR